MDNLSAIQQAQAMFKKLVDSKISGSVKPMDQMRTFPVATLPGGRVVLSNGKTRMSFPAQRARQIQQDNFNQLKSPQQTSQQVQNINMEITTPAKAIALGGPNGQNYFINLLAQILKPRMQGSPEIGSIPTILPGMKDKLDNIERTSALSNLPQLNPDVKSVFDDNSGFYKKYLSNSGILQKTLADEFMTNYNRAESPVVSMGNVRRAIPLSQNYQSRFGIPSANNARYATIGRDAAANGLQQRI